MPFPFFLASGYQLRDWRQQLGLSLRAFAIHVGVSHTAVRDFERKGCDDATYVARVKALIANPPPPPLPPGKRYALLPPRLHGRGKLRWSEYGHATYRLYRPGHADHRRAIVAPPTGVGDRWMERLPAGKVGDLPRRLFELLPDGTAHYLGIIDDITKC